MTPLILLAVAQAFLVYSFVVIQYIKELRTVENVVVWFVLQSFWFVGVGWWLALSLTA